MARAGDGASRSCTRQRTRIIRVRVTAAEQEHIEAVARRRGHASVASYLRDCGLQDARPHRSSAAMIGELGIIGSQLTHSADLLKGSGHDEDARRCREGSHRIVRLQHMLIGEE